ncbi:MAG: hypothetical protein ACO1QS_12660 [Verrucomicrobiota bacterium]
MIDKFIPTIEQISAEGAVVVVKWDGERHNKRCTVLITRLDHDYVWHTDTDDLAGALQSALSDYRVHHPQSR